MTVSGGWVKLHRQITTSDIYMMPPLYQRVFERLIIEANHQDRKIPFKGRGEDVSKMILIRRGERLTSIRQIAEWVSWYERGKLKTPNPKTIREILRWLESNKMIVIITNNGNTSGTHYKIVNYSLYQSNEDIKVTEKKQSLDTNKKGEELKEVYTEYVSLKKEEYQKLLKEHGEAKTKRFIEVLDNYKGATGKTYKSDYRAILSWVVDKVSKETIQNDKENWRGSDVRL